MPAERTDQPVLVIGSGSIGRRHMRNLRALGVTRIAACDVEAARMAPLVDELGVTPYTDLAEALQAEAPRLVLVCTPPVYHVPQALAAVQAGAHVFIEKPLSHQLQGIDDLRQAAAAAGRVVQVGYNLRFHPGIRLLKKLIEGGDIGRPLWASVEAGQYLPDWRPWQDYRQSYTANREMGGGIILDGSHEIDYIRWLLGEPASVLCMAGQVSTLDVNVEDCATLLLRFESGAQADVHLDFVQRTYARRCKIAGDSATLDWDYIRGDVRVLRPDAEPAIHTYAHDPNAMYLDELTHFLQAIDGDVPPVASLDEAAGTLRVALAAHRSADSGQRVTLGG